MYVIPSEINKRQYVVITFRDNILLRSGGIYCTGMVEGYIHRSVKVLLASHIHPKKKRQK